MSPLISCPKCHASLLDGVINRSELVPCPTCATPLQVEIFPALFRKAAVGETGQPVMVEGESACFFHPQKKAVVPCSSCGRFLCALCDCEFAGQHFCPACLAAGKSRGKISALTSERADWGSIALSLAILPILTVFLTMVTAPMTVFICLRYWNAPRSLVRQSRFRLVLALLIALLEIAGWVLVFVMPPGGRR